ncbi:hypothetical protein ACOI1H_21620 [Loktanella sp. DJP18]|uniref:hypothetical protein n=1 Tax=Loktanella sp. DJP18 TaxID=3409788 RepID=UPI003BB4A949
MRRLNIHTTTSAIFTAEIRQHLKDLQRPNQAHDVIGVSDRFFVDDGTITNCNMAQAWTIDTAGQIACTDLFTAPHSLVGLAAAPYFIAFGGDVSSEGIDEMLVDMGQDELGGKAFTVICLPVGMLALCIDPAVAMARAAKAKDMTTIDQDIVDQHIRLLVDVGSSAHERMMAISMVEDFINTMITQTLETRSDRQTWLPFYDNVSIRINSKDMV